jgi:hypothetical protein
MEKLIKSLSAMLIIISLSLFSACDNDTTEPDDPASRHTDAFGDVFIKHVKNNQGVSSYGLTFYAGGEGLTEAVVIAPDGSEYELEAFWKGAGNLRRHPADSEMSANFPQTGEYEFQLDFDNGDAFSIFDTLGTGSIGTVSGMAVQHTPGNDTISVQWNSVAGVDNYYVKLTDKNKNESKPIFNHKKVPASATSYSFHSESTAVPGWQRYGEIAAGDTLYVMVVGLLLEPGTQSSAADMNKQMNSMAAKMIIW